MAKKKLIGYEELKQIVYNYQTKYKEGFIYEEIISFTNSFNNINMDKFWKAMECNTCLIKDGNVVSYHTDVFHALLCGLEDRELKLEEWD